MDSSTTLLVCMVCIPLLVLLSYAAIRKYNNFSKELAYLNGEIRRTDGSARKYWRRRRRRLWLSLIPFVKYD